MTGPARHLRDICAGTSSISGCGAGASHAGEVARDPRSGLSLLSSSSGCRAGGSHTGEVARDSCSSTSSAGSDPETLAPAPERVRVRYHDEIKSRNLARSLRWHQGKSPETPAAAPEQEARAQPALAPAAAEYTIGPPSPCVRHGDCSDTEASDDGGGADDNRPRPSCRADVPRPSRRADQPRPSCAPSVASSSAAIPAHDSWAELRRGFKRRQYEGNMAKQPGRWNFANSSEGARLRRTARRNAQWLKAN